MPKTLSKYFIAIVPDGKIQDDAQVLKEALRENFGIRYGLRSPAHVTLKMPFLWNEKKEPELIKRLAKFLEAKKPLVLQFKDFSNFGNRVIFAKIMNREKLHKLQKELIEYAKLHLKLDLELSDTNYTPHMTIAFKDLKARDFDLYMAFFESQRFRHTYNVNQVSLLKKKEGHWKEVHRFNLDAEPEDGGLA